MSYERGVRKDFSPVAMVGTMPEVQESYGRQMFEPPTGTPAQFSALLRHELDKWSRVIKAASIKPD